ncbi:hypothetical protein M993_00370 [Obesumbacterium proteus ATCC 12841]|uniref:Uncharacterized protein n=1 Tax=Obesumbacterium proteus ATCC 12841 TaxID=1354268 RepID=A0AA91IRR6_9GAMM|nr:hypothetical protein M993_00370 [Obesumbacterium proteus ATCC 12841]
MVILLDDIAVNSQGKCIFSLKMIMQLDINIEHISNKKGEIGLIKQKTEVLFWFFHSQ